MTRLTPLGDVCEAATPACTFRPAHRHHIVLRSQGGIDGPVLDVCAPCHRFIHDHPLVSYEQGWLRHAWEMTA